MRQPPYRYASHSPHTIPYLTVLLCFVGITAAGYHHENYFRFVASGLPTYRYNNINAKNDHWNPQDSGRPRRLKTSSGPRGGPGQQSSSYPASPANAFDASFSRFRFSLESFPWKVFPGKFSLESSDLFLWQVKLELRVPRNSIIKNVLRIGTCLV